MFVWFQRVEHSHTLSIFLCLLSLLLGACTAELKRAYSGPEQPPERVVLLKHQTGFLRPSVYFVRIDGVPLSERKHHFGDVELLPGRHEVEFGFQTAFGFSTENATVAFKAEANHEYEARAQMLPATSVWGTLGIWGQLGSDKWMGIIVDLGRRTAPQATTAQAFVEPARSQPRISRLY